ncbi:MAG: hypothetical protein H0T45_18470, partial [Pyrinomonadaceae bacterium]|nr:hypothetical protein [Pyrinomonadaceae bacterium]
MYAFRLTVAFVVASLILAGGLLIPPSSAQQNKAAPPRRAAPLSQPGAKPTPTPVVQPSPATTEDAPFDPQSIDEDEVVRVTTSEVLLPVTVRDAEGRLV